MPLASALLEFGGFSTCVLDIKVQNPLENPVLLDLQQPLPAGTIVINSSGGTIGTNQIFWELNLDPGDVQSLQIGLILPSPLGQPPLTDTLALAYDEVAANWLQFYASPTLIQMAQSPPALIQSIALTAQGFGFSLETFVPGVYRVEATTDFVTWTPVSMYTNVQGAIRVLDARATTNDSQFYRAVQIK
jgi:hypothetical protein